MGFTFLAQTTQLGGGTTTPTANPPATGGTPTPVAGTGPAPTAPGASTSTAPASTAPGSAPPQKAPGLMDALAMPLMMVLVFVALYFILFRGQRKEEKVRKTQIEAMKKGDEVLLISGKFGKVVDIRDDRVVVKVDEANNVKETYLKSAIQRVMIDSDSKKS